VTRHTSTPTGMSGSPAGQTRSSRLRATVSGPSRSRRPSCAILPLRRRAWPASPTISAARSSTPSSRSRRGTCHRM